MQVRELVKCSKALSDEVRVRMLKLLLEKDICVCEMQEIFPLSESQVSRNLRTLMDAGFLKRWREGKCAVYAVDMVNASTFCQPILESIADSFNEEPDFIEDKKKLQRVVAKQIREKRK